VSGAAYLRYGGNTPCVEIQAGKHILILDAGTGIIQLGKDLLARAKASGSGVEATLLFSHMHHDHTQGFPFFTPAYIGTSHLRIFGPGIFERDLEETLAKTMLPPAFPVSLAELPSLREISTFRESDVLFLGDAVGGALLRNRFHASEEPVTIDDDIVHIRTLRSYAHPDDVLIYRIEWRGKSVVYATDTEGYVNGDQRLAQFAQGADLLIHDAQYTEEHYLGQMPGFGATQGFGHSTASMACGVARAAQVKQLVLFHHEPQYRDEIIADIETKAQRLFANTVSAYEGLTIAMETQPTAAKIPAQGS
jgi:phosphoribosyl 1,2-cyclic phosphodiesterase